MPDETIATRASLLERLKDMDDHASWDEFYRTYRELIYSVARKAGLNETEAEEAVQETLISVAKKMPGFRYDPAVDSFKGWLLTVTRWRILDRPVSEVAHSVGVSAARVYLARHRVGRLLKKELLRLAQELR